MVLIAAHALGRGYLGRDPAGIGLSHYSPIIFCRFKPFDSCCSLTSHPLQPQACLTAQRTKPPPPGGKSAPYASPVHGTGLVPAPAPPTRKSTVSVPFPNPQPESAVLTEALLHSSTTQRRLGISKGGGKEVETGWTSPEY